MEWSFSPRIESWKVLDVKPYVLWSSKWLVRDQDIVQIDTLTFDNFEVPAQEWSSSWTSFK